MCVEVKPKVFITRKVSQQAIEILKEYCEVELWDKEDTPVPRSVLEQKIKDVDGLFCLLTETIDEELLAKATRLKVIGNMAVGYNNINVEAATNRGILVTNTPGILTETTADLTFALLLATARRIVESSEFLREGQWKVWSPMLLTGQDVYGSTLGIVGLGRIGEAVARRAKGFGMDVLYYNRSRKTEIEQELGLKKVDLQTLLEESDFISILAPYTKETQNLIDEKELSMMKSTAILINTARGGIVNEQALYKALKEKQIWAAGLDVFEQEPISLDNPLLTLPNVTALPHIGSASEKTRIQMAVIVAENLIQGLSGHRPNHLVNENAWKKKSI